MKKQCPCDDCRGKEDCQFDCEEFLLWRIEYVEDKLRVNNNQSIRNQGKYGHARGKEKRREP